MTRKMFTQPKRKRYKLVGLADYALFYGPQQEMNSTLFVIREKRRGGLGNGIAEVLSHMGE